MYGLLITSTGWTLEYVDNTPLIRALELVEYIGRRTKGQGQSKMSSTMPPFASTPMEPVHQFTPDTMLALQREMEDPSGQGNPFGNVSHMPPAARAMIDWAEAQLNKGKGN